MLSTRLCVPFTFSSWFLIVLSIIYRWSRSYVQSRALALSVLYYAIPNDFIYFTESIFHTRSFSAQSAAVCYLIQSIALREKETHAHIYVSIFDFSVDFKLLYCVLLLYGLILTYVMACTVAINLHDKSACQQAAGKLTVGLSGCDCLFMSNYIVSVISPLYLCFTYY